LLHDVAVLLVLCLSLCHAAEGLASHVPPLHAPLHVQLKLALVLRQVPRRVLVERVVRVRVHEQVNQAVDARADGQHRLPVLSEDVEAHVAVVVEVGVVHLLRALHLGRFVRVHAGHVERKHELAALVVSLVGLDRDDEVQQVVLPVGELDLHGGSKGELRDVLREAHLTGALLRPRRPGGGLRLGLLLLLVLRRGGEGGEGGFSSWGARCFVSNEEGRPRVRWGWGDRGRGSTVHAPWRRIA